MNVENNFLPELSSLVPLQTVKAASITAIRHIYRSFFMGEFPFCFYLCQFDICQTNSNGMPHSGLALSPKALAADFCKSPGSRNSGRQIGIPYTLPVWREYLPAGWCAPFSAEIDQ